MRIKKFKFTYLLVFASILFGKFMINANASATLSEALECTATTIIGVPCYDSTNNIFFANGVAIEINDNNGKTVISWNGGKQEVPSNVNVFGGAHNNNTEILKTSITMNSGSVNNIFGGGLHESRVKDSYILVKGGTILGDICGGGYAAFITDDDMPSFYNGDSKKSPTRVESAQVIVSGGTGVTSPDSSKVSAIYGGGAGISYTGKADVSVSGGKYGFAIPGGVNGYTGNSNLNVSGGTITNVQHGMRGANGEVSITISNGDIETAYVGTPANATVEKANLNITGGNIANLKLATAKNAQGSSSIGTVTYNEASVKQVDSNFKDGSIIPTLKVDFVVEGKSNELNIPVRDYSKKENFKLLKNELKELLNLDDNSSLKSFYTSSNLSNKFDFKSLKDGSQVYVSLAKVNGGFKKSIIIFTIILALGLVTFMILKNKKIFNT